MGHIINPTLYRIGRVLPWISAGYKRRKNERTKIANEDFLIYNFTRNFFLKKVYKKVIGKLKRQDLKVRYRRKKVRKNKRKKKYGSKALLNNWIIRFSHLSISRFNKTFQLNLFFFDRELQKKYRLRYHRSKKKIKRYEKKKRFKKILQLKKKIKDIKKKIKRITVKRKKKLTTKVNYSGSFTRKGGRNIPVQSVVSSEIATTIAKTIPTTKEAPMNLSFVTQKLKPANDILEKVTVYKDNTYLDGRLLKDRLTKTFEIDSNYYKQLFLARRKPRLFYLKFINKYIANRNLRARVLRPDRHFFENLSDNVNKYMFAKFVQDEKIKTTATYNTIGESNIPYTNVIKNYRQLIANKYNITTSAPGLFNKQFIDNMELKLNQMHTFKIKENLNYSTIISKLSEKEYLKKHFLRLKGYFSKQYRKRLSFGVHHSILQERQGAVQFTKFKKPIKKHRIL